MRTLHLLTILSDGILHSKEELATKLEVEPWTIKRDIEKLRNFGIKIESIRGIGGGYKMVEKFWKY